MKIIGHCRFSFFGQTDTGRDVTTLEAAQERLWNPDRMAVRFHLFENLTLPSIRAQEDKDFSLFVLTSEAMPEIYKDRLSKLVADTPQIEVIFAKSNNVIKELADVNRRATDGGTLRHTQFRVDDDDAIGTAYITKLKEMVSFAPDNAIISMGRGIYAFVDSNGQIGRSSEYILIYNSVGIARVQKAGDLRNPFQMQHRKEFRKGLSVVNGAYPAFIYTLHSTNNTSGYEKTRFVYSSADERFAIKQIKRRNPSLAQDIITEEAQRYLEVSFPWISADALSEVLTKSNDITFSDLPSV